MVRLETLFRALLDAPDRGISRIRFTHLCTVCFIMDKAFCHMEHVDASRKDLFPVIKVFSKVKDADGKMVGPAFKTMKSEFVAWQEAIRAKKV
jgi:D-mannonate dehydratase